ncbi:MAG TPA: PKD domain-containing protein [Marine Group III euryarchaeote]|uniref:PKD domain-containing protein n=1 Tax=Marine Group III euryarchaeote TaxID=2173149 RepID=A0A7C8DKV3_9ARCH|nr:PKD domain-containing protein [Marine Group III euryarchaeote]
MYERKPFAAIMVTMLFLTGCLGTGGGIGSNQNPQSVVTLTGGTNVVNVGDTVQLDGSQSWDEDGALKSWNWDYGDGQSGSGQIVTHKYFQPGEYIVALAVTDDKGAVGNNDHRLTYVTVLPLETSDSGSSPPTAMISASASVVKPGSTVRFSGAASWGWSDGSASTSAVTGWQWQFGDGATGNGVETTHVFGSGGGLTSDRTTGNYPVILTVTGENGLTSSAVYTIRVIREKTVAGEVKNPDTFTTVSIGDPQELDPAHAYDTASGAVIMNAYETLVWYERERTDKLKPMLATEVPTQANGGISPDGLTYTFNIRQNVKFHDGSTLTADDVVFSIKRLVVMNLADGPAWMYTEILNESGIQKIDQYTVQFTLTESAPRFLSIMAYNAAAILSQNWVASRGCGAPIEGVPCENIERDAMGTGPYKFVKWVPDQYVLMEYHPDYWGGWSIAERKAQGYPDGFIKTVYMKKNNDKDSRILELLAGDADFAYVPIADRDKIDGKDGIRIMEGQPTFSMGFIGFNHDIQNWDQTAPSSDFFADINVRKAFCYAFPYQQFITDELDDHALKPKGPVPAGMLGYNEYGPEYDFDLEQAEYYFKEADVWDTGFTLTVYYNSGNTARENGLLMLENNIESLNAKFDLVVQGLEWPDYLDKFIQSEMPLFFLGWAPDYADPHDYVQPFLHSSGHFPYYLSYQNDELDQLIMDAARETDDATRILLYADIIDLEHEEAIYIWTHQGITFHVERDWVDGWYSNPMYGGTYYYSLSKG